MSSSDPEHNKIKSPSKSISGKTVFRGEDEVKELFDHLGIHYAARTKFSEECSVFRETKLTDYPEYLQFKKVPEETFWKFSRQNQDGYQAPTYVKWISDEIGYGVFASEDIAAGSYIAEYTGIVQLKKSVKNRTWSWKYPPKGQFMDGFPDQVSLDGGVYGNETRFINHGDDATANASPVLIYNGTTWVNCYFAKKLIAKDQEILTSYGKRYWKSKSKVPAKEETSSPPPTVGQGTKINLFNDMFCLMPRMFCDKASSSAIDAFQQQGFNIQPKPDLAEMLWIRKGYTSLFPSLKKHQLLNHFPNESALINKGYLTETINEYARNNPNTEVRAQDLYPESYRLYDPIERKAFFDQLPEQDSKENIWIFKPGNESRGRGIEIMWQLDKLREKYATLGELHITEKDDQAIIQRYIKNPLLLNERKSEIRIYWLLASLDPLRVLLFDEGTVRLNSLPYQLDHFDNQLIHVTNVYQQYKHPDYDPNVVLKWSFSQLNSYLHQEKKVASAEFTKDILMPKLKKYLAYLARASRDRFALDYPQSGDCFGLYGADVILDDQLNPYISEIQKGPGLSFNDEIKKHVIPPMLGEAARLMFELRQSRLDGKPLTDFKKRKRYQWVINEGAE